MWVKLILCPHRGPLASLSPLNVAHFQNKKPTSGANHHHLKEMVTILRLPPHLLVTI